MCFKKEMWPPLWGYWFWSLKHCGTLYLQQKYPHTLPDEYKTALNGYFTHMCTYLPCPGCVGHCMRNFSVNLPNYQSGTEVYTKTIDFHNAVNKRTGKLELSYDEVLADLNRQLEPLGYSTDRIHETFLLDWWLALFVTTYTFSTELRKGNDASEAEQTRYRQWLKHACYMMPFHARETEDTQETCLTILHRTVDQAEFVTRDQAQAGILAMYNSVCSYFQQLPKTIAEFTELFTSNSKGQNYVNLVRSQQDSVNIKKKYDTLKAQYDQLASEETLVSNDYYVATIVLGVLLGLAVLWIVGQNWVWPRLPWRQKQRLRASRVSPIK